MKYLSSPEVEYELVQDDCVVAGASGKEALQAIKHYAFQYEQDGPVEIYEVVRRKICLEEGNTVVISPSSAVQVQEGCGYCKRGVCHKHIENFAEPALTYDQIFQRGRLAALEDYKDIMQTEGNDTVYKALVAILCGMESSGGWEGDDELFELGMEAIRKYEEK